MPDEICRPQEVLSPYLRWRLPRISDDVSGKAYNWPISLRNRERRGRGKTRSAPTCLRLQNLLREQTPAPAFLPVLFQQGDTGRATGRWMYRLRTRPAASPGSEGFGIPLRRRRRCHRLKAQTTKRRRNTQSGEPKAAFRRLDVRTSFPWAAGRYRDTDYC